MRLVEGTDYTVENGRMVLSREFLLRRGHCCNSRCKNCPYRTAADQDNSIYTNEDNGS